MLKSRKWIRVHVILEAPNAISISKQKEIEKKDYCLNLFAEGMHTIKILPHTYSLVLSGM